MLSFFPTLYEDELLYSWFARYHVQSCNLSPKATMKDLFGTDNALAVPDLPTNLVIPFNRINHFDVPSLETWVNKHTLYRYYTTFTKETVKKLVFDAIVTGNSPGSIHLTTGIVASKISEPAYFRFCSECMAEDIRIYGETYWRLSFQLPSVLICLKHGTALHQSSVSFRSKQKHVYTEAHENNSKVNLDTPIYTDKTTGFLRIFAEESIRLIQNDYQFSWEGWQQAYRYLLQKNSYFTPKGHVNQHKLTLQFRRYYGDEFLNLMQSPIYPESQTCWLKSMARKHRKAFHPIRHLLLIHFLGETLDTFYQYSTNTYDPFGKKPYLCVNAAASHYLQPVISKIKMTRCSDTGRPVGTFECSCGFIYSRRGPDKTEEDRFKIGRIKQFGQVWFNRLNQLLDEEKVSFYKAAQSLKVNIGTIKKYSSQKVKPLESSKDELDELLNSRNKWIELQKEYPNASKTELRRLNPTDYIWLYRHDRHWLDENSPKRKRTLVHNRVNWEERDHQILKETKNAVQKLLSSEKPIRINVTRIGKETRFLALLECHLDKLPKTRMYLNDVLETVEEFQIRRVQWASMRLYRQHEEVIEWRIKRMAGLKKMVSNCVKEEIDKQVGRYRDRKDG